MKLDLTGLRIEVTDAIRDFTERKIKKLDKFFDENTICHVTFTDKPKGKQHIDIRIEQNSHTFLAEENAEDLYYGIESAISKIEGQIRKEKTAREKMKRSNLIDQNNAEDIDLSAED